jgi:hypothetical protein
MITNGRFKPKESILDIVMGEQAELHNDIAEMLNDYTTDRLTFESVGFAVESNSRGALGRDLAQEVLEEHDAVMIKAIDTDDGYRMWFDTLKEEEVVETYHTV